MFRMLGYLALFAIAYAYFFGSDKEVPKQTKEVPKQTEEVIVKNSRYDDKYAICYGEMTKAHKARGFHQSNRSASIKVKETVCKAYAKGDIDSYEGKR